jgi:dUTP pyrophosphatase
MKNVINLQDARNAAQNMVAPLNKEKEERKSMFEELMKEVENINPELGGFEELGALLALPDEEFNLIAPIFLDELQKSMNNVDDKLLLVQAMNLNGTKLEDLQTNFEVLCNELDTQFKDVLSTSKVDFLKQMMGITYNCISEAEGVAKRIIAVPIELTSENAKMPKYAHLGDGAVDLYSPEEYIINPGETKIIPVDIKVALPYGYAFLIHPRSGLSAKSKLRVANSIGLIDSQYKGVIGVIVENIEPKIKDIDCDYVDGKLVVNSIAYGAPYVIGKGERFAQMRLVEVPTVNFYQVDSVDTIGDDRGGGFGSSGKN